MDAPTGPPALSTPDAHILETLPYAPSAGERPRLSDEVFQVRYEIERTIAEIRRAGYTRIALQFPDTMLPDAPRVFQALSKRLVSVCGSPNHRTDNTMDGHQVRQGSDSVDGVTNGLPAVRLYILADTSYGACCVDEIAAEHVNADAVVHYGRACLSPTARTPVIHIFTRQPIWNRNELSRVLQDIYQDKNQKVLFMADVTYQHHLEAIGAAFKKSSCCKIIHVAEVVHDPSSPLPNRTVPEEVKAHPAGLKEWHVFHISHPPESLLLTLASRVASVRIFTPSDTEQGTSDVTFLASTSRALNRRYALLTSVTTVSIFGILINTLSVANYLSIVEHVKAQILAAGKKSYTFVVGKVNAAKVANFSEIGAWVVIGCWESSLIDSKDFWRPILTPFELELALKGDHERIWTGEWNSDFQKILDKPSQPTRTTPSTNGDRWYREDEDTRAGNAESEPDSAPPDFDLRTGRYVSQSRPIEIITASDHALATDANTVEKSLIQRSRGDLAFIGGKFSPGAEHLQSKRTWTGLGSDFEIAYEEAGADVEQGRVGIAKGYTCGQRSNKT